MIIRKSFNPDIPRHLLTTEDAEILKNVVLHSVATAFASIVCNKRMEISINNYQFNLEEEHHQATS